LSVVRVLLVKLSSLGDVVHAMPVVHDIRTAHPGALIDWVVEPGFAPLVRRVAGIGQVFECAQRRWRKAWWSGERGTWCFWAGVEWSEQSSERHCRLLTVQEGPLPRG